MMLMGIVETKLFQYFTMDYDGSLIGHNLINTEKKNETHSNINTANVYHIRKREMGKKVKEEQTLFISGDFLLQCKRFIYAASCLFME